MLWERLSQMERRNFDSKACRHWCVCSERVLNERARLVDTKSRNMNEHATLPPQPTSSMKQFDILVGEWTMVGTHPEFPDAAHGHSSFEWLVEGGLLVWHFNWERGGPPSALSVIGHDEQVET